jgi:hypothetical protein
VTFKHPTILELPHAGRVIQMGAPSSQQFKLTGGGEASAVSLMWQPEGREAFEIEVRARVMGNSGAAEDIPIIRWKTELGAGSAVWKEPFQFPGDTPAHPGFAVPARGMVWRTAPRQFRISFFNDGSQSGNPIGESTVQVTFLPVWGGVVDSEPFSDTAEAGIFVSGALTPFPMTVREWRVQTDLGVPFAPGVNGLAFVGMNGVVFGGGSDSADYADWQPIPFDAVGVGFALPSYVAYR